MVRRLFIAGQFLSYLCALMTLVDRAAIAVHLIK